MPTSRPTASAGPRWQDEGIITDGYFDSQNIIFWDEVRGEYREYHRDFVDGRDIKTAVSGDFMSWPEPEWVTYTPGRVSELYTNGVIPYYRAPHIFLGFPTRYTDRGLDRVDRPPAPARIQEGPGEPVAP